MGFFDMFKKKSEPAAPAGPLVVAADARGTVVRMEDIPDEVFAQGILGPCCGIDPEVYSGFAFGIGIDRVCNAKFGISDIRLLYENDLRFLSQF